MIIEIVERKAVSHYSFIHYGLAFPYLEYSWLIRKKTEEKTRRIGMTKLNQGFNQSYEILYCVKHMDEPMTSVTERAIGKGESHPAGGAAGSRELSAPATSRSVWEEPRHVGLHPILNDIIRWLFLHFLWCSFHLFTLSFQRFFHQCCKTHSIR